jgi:hypothetical protein
MMKAKFLAGWTACGIAALTGLLIVAIYWCGAECASAQTSASGHAANLDEIVKLTKAQMTDDVILNFIKGSGNQYNLSADDLVYLKSQGVSQPVISALLQTPPMTLNNRPPQLHPLNLPLIPNHRHLRTSRRRPLQRRQEAFWA